MQQTIESSKKQPHPLGMSNAFPDWSVRLRRLNPLRTVAHQLSNLPYSEHYVPFLRRGMSEAICHWQYGRGDMPLIVGIETTVSCNRSCGYCTLPTQKFEMSRSEKRMSIELFRKILTELSELPRTQGRKGFCGTLHLNAYGEPLVDTRIVELTSMSRSMLPESRIGFYSNGDLLTEKNYLDLRDAGIDEILITPHDGQHRSELVVMAKKYEKDGIIKLLPPLKSYSNRGGSIILTDEGEYQSPPRFCIHPTYSLEIFSSGGVAYCANDSYLKRPMGSVKDGKIMDIWDNPTYARLRNDLRKGDQGYLPDICLACRNPHASSNHST